MMGVSGVKQDSRDEAPYIAAKFPQRNIPYTFHLGNGATYEGFVNRPLERGRKYRIFVRAVVDTPQKVKTTIQKCFPIALSVSMPTSINVSFKEMRYKYFMMYFKINSPFF